MKTGTRKILMSLVFSLSLLITITGNISAQNTLFLARHEKNLNTDCIKDPIESVHWTFLPQNSKNSKAYKDFKADGDGTSYTREMYHGSAPRDEFHVIVRFEYMCTRWEGAGQKQEVTSHRLFGSLRKDEIDQKIATHAKKSKWLNYSILERIYIPDQIATIKKKPASTSSDSTNSKDYKLSDDTKEAFKQFSEKVKRFNTELKIVNVILFSTPFLELLGKPSLDKAYNIGTQDWEVLKEASKGLSKKHRGELRSDCEWQIYKQQNSPDDKKFWENLQKQYLPK